MCLLQLKIEEHNLQADSQDWCYESIVSNCVIKEFPEKIALGLMCRVAISLLLA